MPSMTPAAPPPRDRINIRGLKFVGHHGCFDYERRDGCRFEVHCSLQFDTRLAAHSDLLRDTVDYGAVAATLLRVGKGESVQTVERLASLMADALLHEFPIIALELGLEKCRPALDGEPDSVGVTIHRRRLDGPT